MSGRRNTKSSMRSKSRRQPSRKTHRKGIPTQPAAPSPGKSAGSPSVAKQGPFIPADLILYNGRIYTHTARSHVQEAVAIFEGRIFAVGTSSEMLALAGEKTRKIDLKGHSVFPGFTDCHIHLILYGLSLKELNLRDVRSIAELKELVSNVASTLEPGRWILGRGWDQDRLEEKRYPLRWDLDQAAPQNPVFLDRICGHIAVANSLALELADVGPETVPPAGGVIDHVPNTGEVTGILRENAKTLVEQVAPKPEFEDYVEAAKAACSEAVKAGLASIHCVTYSPDEIRAFQELRRRKELPLRVFLMPALENTDAFLKFGFQTGFGDDWLKLGALKLFTDGSLGARTAALNEPYSDDPGNYGVLVHEQEELDQIVRQAHENGIQLAIHAIGDRAVAAALDALERALLIAPNVSHRHRIEHASVLSPDLVERMKKLEVIASIQPRFVVSDFWAEDRVGAERLPGVYPFRSLLERGIITIAGSDCPVEPLDPLEGIRAAVKRDGRNMNEALSVEDALRLYTTEPPKATFEEEQKGSIEPRKLADLVVLSDDPYKARLEDVQVDLTIVNGEVVFQRN